ncbi:MAG: 1-deoxy-D-xylulose-5-phosphate reductoisomerase [Sphingobacteriales bacterium]|jgi:1-deoxy-D-xylulose-5-phosphate reductoisomerase
METFQKRRIAILGSTGSIGTQALDVVQANPEKFEVEFLTAGRNIKLLAAQAIKFNVPTVVISQADLKNDLQKLLTGTSIKVYAGNESVDQVIENSTIDMLLTAMVGYAGLKPTLTAIERKIDIALANKETLVVAGDIVTQKAKAMGVNIYPVDSEHSAIYQCLVGEESNPIEKIYLTASGGPFRGKKRHELEKVTRAQALKHPNWEMGAKITIDSASLMNKGLEVIEAKWLFDLSTDQIDVVVHPQSIIHSIAQFEDGSMKAQMGLPDMKLPIQYALAYPQRIKSNFERFNFMNYPNLTFEKPDLETFRNLGLAFKALETGGNMPCIINAANEIMVAGFLKEQVGFLEMSDVIEECMSKVEFIKNPTYEEYVYTDEKTRIIASQLIASPKSL